MLFSLVVAEFGLAVGIWLICASITFLIVGAVALIKSEGAAAPPFAGFLLGAGLAYYIVAVRHGFGSPRLLRWAPIFPSLGFSVGLISLWPSPRKTGLAVAGCLLLVQGSNSRVGGIIVIVLIGSLFAGSVPLASSLLIFGTLWLSYWGRVLPWLEAAAPRD